MANKYVDLPPRRPLPNIDPGPEEVAEKWLSWFCEKPRNAGWYWVWSKGMWPQVSELVYKNGNLEFMDRHAIGSYPDPAWTHFAGPIPMPLQPIGRHAKYWADKAKRKAERDEEHIR